MVKIIEEGPHWARIRASWLCVQRASCERAWASSCRRNRPTMDGSENVLFTFAKAYHKGSGLWLIKGDTLRDGGDIGTAVERMRRPWSPSIEGDRRPA